MSSRIKLLPLLAIGLLALGACGRQAAPTRQNTAASSQSSTKQALAEPKRAHHAKPDAPAKSQSAQEKAPTPPAPPAYQSTAAPAVQQAMVAPIDHQQPKSVYLTFDDGPNWENTPKVLDILAKSQVPATFFVVGTQLGPKTQPLLKQMRQAGHQIGLHSSSHDYLKLYPGRSGNPNAITADFAQERQALARLLPDYRPTAFRYPGGHMSWRNLEPSDRALASMGLTSIDWNSAIGDAISNGPTTVAGMLSYQEKALEAWGEHNATVLLMHDAPGKALTVATLPKLIDWFKARHYQFKAIH